MGVYFSMVAENGEVVIDRRKLLIGNIWERILEEKKQFRNRVEFGKEYYIDISDIPKIIEYYEKQIDGVDDEIGFGEVGFIRNNMLPSLKRQLDYQISDDRKYIVKWD